jgi:hypothetical protein
MFGFNKYQVSARLELVKRGVIDKDNLANTYCAKSGVILPEHESQSNEELMLIGDITYREIIKAKKYLLKNEKLNIIFIMVKGLDRPLDTMPLDWYLTSKKNGGLLEDWRRVE